MRVILVCVSLEWNEGFITMHETRCSVVISSLVMTNVIEIRQ